MSLKGQTVWTLRAGAQYDGAVIVGVYASREGAHKAAGEFMDREDDKVAQHWADEVKPWKYEEEDGNEWWENDRFWLHVRTYEIE